MKRVKGVIQMTYPGRSLQFTRGGVKCGKGEDGVWGGGVGGGGGGGVGGGEWGGGGGERTRSLYWTRIVV